MKDCHLVKNRWRMSRGQPIVKSVLLTLVTLLLGSSYAFAGAGTALSSDASGNPKNVPTYYANSPAGIWTDWNGGVHDSGTALRKFVDPLPVPCDISAGTCTGSYLSIAKPDKTTYPGSDYYEIAVVEYSQKMHTDLAKPTKLRGYVQLQTAANISKSRSIALTYPNGSPIADINGNAVIAYDNPSYLGPVIIAAKGTPVRIKYLNLLPPGADGDLFIPVDKTLMGAGTGPDQTTYYTENRIAIHHHGGDTPWISDGTPSQWISPVGELNKYKNGDSFSIVPDMPDPGAGKGAGTLYFTNDISGRLMFYHDHAMGTTRLNVYAGMAAAFLQTDASERALVPDAPEIPLVIQDKTFVPKDILVQDANWNTTHWGQEGDLWFPNVYEFNQDLTSGDLTNPPGRWDYGPYFWPAFPVAPGYVIPDGTWDAVNNRSNATTTPEAFNDTPIVNGKAYPTLTVEPKPYRFRILNAANDRFLNLGLYQAKKAIDCTAIATPGTGYAVGDVINLANIVPYTAPPAELDATVPNAQPATATVTAIGPGGAITGFVMNTFGTYVSVPTVTKAIFPSVGTGATFTCALSGLTEVAMVPFDSSTPNIPVTGGILGTGWGTQVGGLFPMGVPSPATVGPDFVQIGTEGGILPVPVPIPSTPINFEYNKRSVTVLNMFEHGLLLGNAERADVIVDFTGKAGTTYILYNDAPAPVPAGDPRIDYYTGNPDFTDAGGAATTRPGQGPNTRTVMQIVVAGSVTGTPQSLATLATDVSTAYAATQPKPIVAQKAYTPAFPSITANTYANIRTGTLYVPTFNFTTGDAFSYYGYVPGSVPLTLATTRTNVLAGQQAQMPVQNKAIQELFDPWGRMNATLGVELPFTNGQNQTTVPLTYIDPATEKIEDGETQIWKITHNGVDTHPVHFHLVNVQLINRVGWDGTLKTPDANEVGWKETVRMNPLEDVIVAVRANAPKLPFGVPESSRLLSPTEPVGSTMSFSNLDPLTGNQYNPPITNQVYSFNWEYVWHCHILGHEENDFMRPFIFKYTAVVPDAPINTTPLTYAANPSVTWTDLTPALPLVAGQMQNLGNPKNEIGFKVERCPSVCNATSGTFTEVGRAVANATSYADMTATTDYRFTYRVKAYNAAGDSVASSLVTTTTTSPVAGVCGTSNGLTAIAAPTTNLCGVGTATTVTGAGPWAWTCTGFNAGTTANCSAPIQTYVLTYNAGANGTLTGTTVQTVNYNASATAVTAVPTPNSAYRFVGWKNANTGAVVSTLAAFTATNVVANATYIAVFAVPGDFNGDGTVDILWTDTSTNQSYIWYMDGASPNKRLAQVALPAAPGTTWTIVAKGDFDSDGNTDILWRDSATGANLIWYMNGATKIGQASLQSLGTAWVAGGVGDFNADGHPDIVWRKATTGQQVVWHMNNATLLSAVLTSTTFAVNDPLTYIAGVGDFNRDGKADILFRKDSTSTSTIWYMNDTTVSSTATLQNLGSTWSAAGVGDFNSNGTADILWRKVSTGQQLLWYMNNATMSSSVILSDIQLGSQWKIVGH